MESISLNQTHAWATCVERLQRWSPLPLFASCNQVLNLTCVCPVKRLVKEDRFPHVLFYGPPGTGKTSTILAVARQMYGASLRSMVLELNASDDRGIGIVREQVVDFASTKTMFR